MCVDGVVDVDVAAVIMQRGSPEKRSAGLPSRIRLARISFLLHSSVEIVVVTLLSVLARSDDPPDAGYRCCCTRYCGGSASWRASRFVVGLSLLVD